MENQTFDNSSFTAGEYKSPQAGKMSSRSPKRFLMIIFLVIILAAVGYGATKFLGTKGTKETKETKTQITPTPTEYQFPTDTPAPSVSPTPKASPTPTAKPTTSPIDKTTGLDRSTLTVEIQNGSGAIGVASKMSDVIKGFGYRVASVGNADNYNYENITISVKSDFSKYLPLLKSDLSKDYTIGTTSSDLSASSSADALIIIGK